MPEKYKSLMFEFMRYILVGGSAFLIDFGTLWIFKEFIFLGKHLFIATFIGYMVGLIYNFILSSGFVFKDGFKKIKHKEIQSFIIFTSIGLIGLGLTEVLMYLFVNIVALYYLFAKIITGAIVVFWNYIARKVIIYK